MIWRSDDADDQTEPVKREMYLRLQAKCAKQILTNIIGWTSNHMSSSVHRKFHVVANSVCRLLEPFCPYQELLALFSYLIPFKIKWRMRFCRLNLTGSEENWKGRQSAGSARNSQMWKMRRVVYLRKGIFESTHESVARRNVNFSACLLFVLSNRSIFYRASNQRATTAQRSFRLCTGCVRKSPQVSHPGCR